MIRCDPYAYGFWPRLLFYIATILVGAVLGVMALCVIALVDQARGVVVPWLSVVSRGATIGAIGASVGGLLVFKP